MAKETKFNPDKLRTMISEGKNANEIMAAFDIKKPALKLFQARLMNIDQQFYAIPGLEERAVGSQVEFKKGGIKLSPVRLEGFGFKLGSKFNIVKQGNDILLKSID